LNERWKEKSDDNKEALLYLRNISRVLEEANMRQDKMLPTGDLCA
jgi:hypothetical protein